MCHSLVHLCGSLTVERKGGGYSLLGSLGGLLLATLLLWLLGAGSRLFDAVDLLNHESTGDSVSDGSVVEDTAIGTGDSAAGGTHSSEISGASDLHTSELVALGAFFEVLDAKLATRGSNLQEFVSLGSV